MTRLLAAIASRSLSRTLPATLSLVAALAAGARAEASELELGLEVQLGGGSVLAWDGPDETGNAFGGVVLVGLGDFAVGLGAAMAMPDSRLQGQFGAFWAEGRWAFLGRDWLITPYGVLGLGFATADGFERSGTGFSPARWSTGAGFLGMLGAGLRFGERTGMSLSVDVRTWNVSHLGFQLIAGYRFF